MAKVYAIMSGKGGVGKTTSTVNLGTCFNHLGENVIIVDGNLTTPNLGIHLGAPVVPTTLNHVLKGKAKLDEGKFEDALGFFEQALLLEQKNPELWNSKGVALRSIGRYDEAIECFNKSLEIDPRDKAAS